MVQEVLGIVHVDKDIQDAEEAFRGSLDAGLDEAQGMVLVEESMAHMVAGDQAEKGKKVNLKRPLYEGNCA